MPTASTTSRTKTTRRTIALPDKSRGPQTQRTKTSAAQRAAALKKKHEQAERRRKWLISGSVTLVVILVIVGIAVLLNNSNKSPAGSGSAGALGPEGIPVESGTVLAKPSASVTGQALNGVQCGSTEQLDYHIHARLTIYDNGKLQAVPAGVGIIEPSNPSGTGDQEFVSGATKCFYWLHTHAQDGVVHVESPTTKLYPLSDFFAIWGQPLSKSQVGPAKGTVTAYVNGKKFTGDPQTITLSSHEDIQLDVGTPAPAPITIDWSKSQL